MPADSVISMVQKYVIALRGAAASKGVASRARRNPGSSPHARTAYPSPLSAPFLVGALVVPNSAWVAGRTGGLAKENARTGMSAHFCIQMTL